MENWISLLRGLAGWRAALLAILGGVICTFSLPPYGLWPALIVGFGLGILLLDGIGLRHETARQRIWPAFRLGWCFAFGYFGASLYWIGEAFLVDAEIFAWLLPLALSAMPAGLGLFWGAAFALAALSWSPGPWRVWTFAAALAAAEWLRGNILTGFPWNAPAYGMDSLLVVLQAASVVGLFGLNLFVIAWVCSPMMLTGDRSSRRGVVVSAGLAAATLAAAILFGVWRTDDAPVASEISVRIVQPNVAQTDKWRPENRRWIYTRYLDMTASPAPGKPRARIVVWPESALPVYVDEVPNVRKEIARAAGPGSFTVLGALRRGPVTLDGTERQTFNSVLAIDDAANVAAVYDKQQLVPFGEYLPLANWLEPLGVRRLVVLPGGFGTGVGPQTVSLPAIPAFAPLICYEAIFPRYLISRDNRPSWLLNVTNDAWFGTSIGPHQHLSQARLRAIEEGLPFVRAANTGISAVIDPYGRMMNQLPLGQPGVIDAFLPQELPPTIFSKFGDWLFFAILGAILIGRTRTFFC
jgi:apolipoprotein N-acyltransferase